MKRLYYLLLLLVAFNLVACSNEEDDLFNDSSANRSDASVQEVMDVLTGSEKGWVMGYFLDANFTYGGYNTLFKFYTDGTIDVASELFAANKVASSLYSVSQSGGVVISMDTYNDIFSAFSDPSAPLGIGDNGEGLGGDNDFLVISVSKEEIVLKGRKSGHYATLVPIETEWTTFLNGINETRAEMATMLYQINVGQDSARAVLSNNTFVVTYTEGQDEKIMNIPFVVRTNKYVFYEPIELLGTTISGFDYTKESDSFTAMNDANITMKKIIPPLNMQFVNDNWYFKVSEMSPMNQVVFNYVKSNGLDPIGEELIYAYMGDMLYGSYGFNFNSSGFTGLLSYTYKLIGDDQIELTFAWKQAGNGGWYFSNAQFFQILNLISLNDSNTFTLTTDNIRKPSYIKLTDSDDANNWMILYKETVLNPFN